MVIKTENLNRTFNVRLKAEGLVASFKSFFNPTYRKVEAVKQLNIEVGEGEIIGFLGSQRSRKNNHFKNAIRAFNPY